MTTMRLITIEPKSGCKIYWCDEKLKYYAADVTEPDYFPTLAAAVGYAAALAANY